MSTEIMRPGLAVKKQQVMTLCWMCLLSSPLIGHPMAVPASIRRLSARELSQVPASPGIAA
jgi:hypothetical protein